MNPSTRARGLGDTDPLAKRRAAREAAISGVTSKTKGKTKDAPPADDKTDDGKPPAPKENDTPPVIKPDDPPPAPLAKTRRQAKPRTSAPQPAAPPVSGGVPMPPPKRGGGARVQFNTRIRPDVAGLLNDFVAENPATMQDIADMALLEFLARREFRLPGDSTPVPTLPAAPPVSGGVPMPPPKRGGGARVQFNTRIRPDVAGLLNDFVAENPATMQDIADMALLEFLAVRGFEPTQRK